MTPAAHRAAAEAAATLLTDAGRADPYPFYARMRENDPVHVGELGAVMLTRYGDCVSVLRDPDYLVNDFHLRDEYLPRWREASCMTTIGSSMLFINPPEHTRLRRLVSGAFTARRVQALRDRVERLVADHLDAMADAGSTGSTIDLRDMFAFPLPVSVIGALVGVPERDWGWLQQPAAGLTAIVDLFITEEELEVAERSSQVMAPYFLDLMAERRREPRDDLTSALLTGQRDAPAGEGASDDEILRILMLLFIAGFETTVNLITNGVVAMFDHPDQVARYQADPSLTPGLVEEVLRYDSPVQATSRVTTTDTHIGGQPVAAGTSVLTFLGAANRDPEAFTDPDRLDITRTGPRITSFGGGAHFCLGAQLARLEAAIAFPALYRRFPRLRLAGAPTRRTGFNLRGWATLPVTIT